MPTSLTLSHQLNMGVYFKFLSKKLRRQPGPCISKCTRERSTQRTQKRKWNKGTQNGKRKMGTQPNTKITMIITKQKPNIKQNIHTKTKHTKHNQQYLFEGVSLNSRHPSPRRVWKGGSERRLRDHFVGIRGMRGIRQ